MYSSSIVGDHLPSRIPQNQFLLFSRHQAGERLRLIAGRLKGTDELKLGHHVAVLRAGSPFRHSSPFSRTLSDGIRLHSCPSRHNLGDRDAPNLVPPDHDQNVLTGG
jgi:hypothetical protein